MSALKLWKTKSTGRIRLFESRKWKKSSLKGILKKFSQHRILVIGDLGIDQYTCGVVERISPEAPVPIVRVTDVSTKLGLAANVADNIVALGGKVDLLGIVGADSIARVFRQKLRSVGISENFLIEDRSRRTTLKERIGNGHQYLLRVDTEDVVPPSQKILDRVYQKFLVSLKSCSAVIIEDYAKGLLSPKLTHAIYSRAGRFGKLVVVDPNSQSPLDLYVGAHVLRPNKKEAETLAGGKQILDGDSLLEVGETILRMTSAKMLAITLGKDGIAVFTQGDPQVSIIPGIEREVYDVSGAGDTVASVMTLALVSGAGLTESAILGNLAGTIEVGKRGTATVSRREIEQLLDTLC